MGWFLCNIFLLYIISSPAYKNILYIKFTLTLEKEIKFSEHFFIKTVTFYLETTVLNFNFYQNIKNDYCIWQQIKSLLDLYLIFQYYIVTVGTITSSSIECLCKHMHNRSLNFTHKNFCEASAPSNISAQLV